MSSIFIPLISASFKHLAQLSHVLFGSNSQTKHSQQLSQTFPSSRIHILGMAFNFSLFIEIIIIIPDACFYLLLFILYKICRYDMAFSLNSIKLTIKSCFPPTNYDFRGQIFYFLLRNYVNLSPSNVPKSLFMTIKLTQHKSPLDLLNMHVKVC